MTKLALTYTLGSGPLQSDFDQLKGLLQLGGYSSDKYFESPTTDHLWNGNVMILTAGENVVLGDVCYLKSDGKFWKAKADAEATADTMLVISTATISANATGVFMLEGFIRDDSLYNMTVGKKQYISAATGGAITETAPATSTNIVRIIGYGYSADVLYFKPSGTYITVT